MSGTFFNLAAAIAIIINISVALLFGFDKWEAKRGGWRVSENILLVFALFAPFGAISGMMVFRHKVRKIKFIVVVPVFTIIQAILLFLFLS